MDTEERLRRRREQYRVRQSRETAEEKESRGWKQGEHCERRRRAMMSTEQRQMLLQRRREAIDIAPTDDEIPYITAFYHR